MAQLAPPGRHRKRGQGSGWKVGAELVSVGSAADQLDGQVLNARVVADDEHAAHAGRKGTQTGQEVLSVSAVEIVLDQDLDLPGKARSDQVERLPGAERG